MNTTIKQSDSTVQPLYGDLLPVIGDESDDRLLFGIRELASMSAEAVYVMDFYKRNFRFVSNHPLFLCGSSVEEVLLQGYSHFQKVIHPKELPLFMEVQAAILQRLHGMKDLGDIAYFSFAVRIKNRSKYMMGFHKLKPLFVDGQVRFGVCLLSSSALKRAGNLRLHYHNGVDVEEYFPSVKEWRKTAMPLLTKREEEVIRLTKRGKKRKDIAEKLHISRHTLQNIKVSLFTKLNVISMMQAIGYVTEHQLLFSPSSHSGGQAQMNQVVKRRRRRLITSDMAMRIQEGLHRGESVRSIAKRELIAESAIRYAINKGKLKKPLVSILKSERGGYINYFIKN